MNILDTIIERKKTEVHLRKGLMPVHVLEKFPFFDRPVLSLAERLLSAQTTGIIAEFKRKSPSKGIINAEANVAEVVKAYADHGSAAVSVLTDEYFFGGSNDDLMIARETINIPILRKEFIIDEYQIIEAKALGADLILLIAACLKPDEVRNLSATATSLGLEVLLELHDEEELDRICEQTGLIGINNRSLKTFKVDIERSLLMAEKIPQEKIRIAESGISDPDNIILFRNHGFKGFLIGENFMKEKNPAEAFRHFVSQLNQKA